MSPPQVLVVTGPPASGKTTVGRRMARDLELPYFSKDLLKESLFDSLGWDDRAWSQKLGRASIRLLYVSAAALLEAGRSVALECNFYATLDTPELLKLSQNYGCGFVQVVCSADGATLVGRFEQRARSGERHPGHRDDGNLDEFRTRLLTERWDALPLEGPVIEVDTTHPDAFDYQALLTRVTAALRTSSYY